MESLLIACVLAVVVWLLLGYRRVAKRGDAATSWLFAYRLDENRKQEPPGTMRK